MSRDGDREWPRPLGRPLCRCRPPRPVTTLLKVKKDGPNHGKWFFKCDDCNYFKFANELPGYPNIGEPSGGSGGAQQGQTSQYGTPPSTAQRGPGQPWGSPLPFQQQQQQSPGYHQQQQQQHQPLGGAPPRYYEAAPGTPGGQPGQALPWGSPQQGQQQHQHQGGSPYGARQSPQQPAGTPGRGSQGSGGAGAGASAQSPLPPGVKGRVHAKAVGEGLIALPYPYDPDFVSAVKAMDWKETKRRWNDAPRKYWTVREESIEMVRRELGLAGYEVVGPPNAAASTPEAAAPRVALEPLPASIARRVRNIPEGMWARLMPFQREGVMFALQRQGRVLLADEMGLGKTLQAIAIAACYPEDWPLLVVCPAGLKRMWATQLREWLPPRLRPDPDDFWVVDKGADLQELLEGGVPEGRKHICVIAYSLVDGLEGAASRYKAVICDEAHSLKTRTAKRTKFMTKARLGGCCCLFLGLAFVSVVKEAARAVLISGTPLMSRPIEMWTQVEMLRPGLLGSYEAYGDRFCVDLRTLAAGGGGRGGGGGGAAGGWMDPYRGARDLDELRALLEQNVMLRRTKESVDMALPPKMRHRIEIQVKLPERRHEIASIRSSMAAVSAELAAAPRDSAEAQRLATRRMLLTSELYRATGRAKLLP
ncbi:hypothetical protein Rsub_01904 [Raphidocelis subcapitata]|uniref:Helicase ATP-binding domain-containing protein n=1 Tax=Raphidocelis subcapitata TaxID=307507 RepID=A0A2V0NW70_9CHLO|nr:hypothetical protein Rsub_01904 [Raphidocelis subcapitata]|eukprot:GBF89187.1 hypothetical protein Rsub_01904 [Raphidocelis subcapitata]